MTDESFRRKLRTVQLVPITAFDADGELNLDPMKRHTRRLFDAGVRCFIPCAGSAEFHSLSSAEILAGVSMTRETAGDSALVLAPVGQQIREALQLGKDALSAGASAVLVMPLAHPYLSDAGARDYLLALLEELSGPVLIYKTGPIPSDDLLLALAEHPNLAGVKYAVNDLDAFQRVVQNDNERIEWICGSAERFAPYFMLAGATGYTSGAGNICPKLTLNMHRAILEDRWTDAMYWQKFIRPIEDFRARAGSSYNVSFLKYAIRATGLDFGEVRPPQRRLTESERQEADRVVSAALAAEQELT
jgi:4-hydroxy-tetrahydrodipicolinate synthase